MECPYEEHEPERFVCPKCGDVRTKRVRRNCPATHRGFGIGDTLARAFAALGIKAAPGCGCRERQALLNRLFPYSPEAWKARARAIVTSLADLPAWLIGKERRPPRVLQIAPTIGTACGIGNFAQNLHDFATCAGLPIETYQTAPADIASFDVALFQHERSFYLREPHLFAEQAQRLAAAGIHRVGFIHSPVDLGEHVDAYLTMAPGMVETDRPVHVVDLPAYPAPLICRSDARAAVGLDQYRVVVGTHGFITPARRFDDFVRVLAPLAAEVGGALLLNVATHEKAAAAHRSASDRLHREAAKWPNVYVSHGWHSPEAIGAMMQLADINFVWTTVSSSPYASAVASDLYGTGVRLIAADKLQHRAVLARPNTVAAPEDFDGFAAAVAAEMQTGPPWPRHDPTPLTWPAAIVPLFDILARRT